LGEEWKKTITTLNNPHMFGVSMTKNPRRFIWLYVLIILLLLLSALSKLITDYWWFETLGYASIFLISIKSKIVLFTASTLIFFSLVMLNLFIVSKFYKIKKSIISWKMQTLVVLVMSFLLGMGTSNKWFTVLQYLKQVQFKLADPIFIKDVAFYVFSLPLFLAVWEFAMICMIITTLLVLIIYFQTFILNLFKQQKPREVQANYDLSNKKLEDDPKEHPPSISFKKTFAELGRRAKVHLTILSSIIFLLLAGKHYLAQYSIMYSEKGIVVGAGYTDVVVFLPIIKILILFAIIITALFYVWLFYISKKPKLKKLHIVASIIGLYLIFSFIAPTLIPSVVQALKVSPNELNLEKPFIENNIKFTKIAYGLDDVVEKDFSTAEKINKEMLETAAETIENVRILDWRPLTQTYKQTQEIRLYYDLSGIDIDRYVIDGKYTQVMIAPRELDQNQIAENAKTWVNLHMIYTHGFGIVMSPVNLVTDEGLPHFFVKDIPPINLNKDKSLDVEEPRIYYGEKQTEFILANTQTKEFDFPKGTTNEYINYDGKGGIVLDTFFKKLLMAMRFKDIKILLSSDVKSNSKIMFDRSIQTRINKITPFLSLDQDPYLVLSEGRLFWIQDAYTTTGNFPYSQKFGDINYMRNSVKIVVDAYNGDVTYYVTNLKDPLMLTYAKIFPLQFKQLKDMPKGLQEHIRYPEDLFKVQSSLYTIYHMNDPAVFYNKEDAWQIPTEIYGTNQQIKVEPYYIIMKLPGEEKEEFVLMTPFTPLKKDNMISWFAARSDGENYGKLLLYKFPKDKLVYGPLQIEAKFDQDSEISQQLTLWSQQGSRVTRGNLLVIPIEDSLLYIEPLYISAEKGQLPQLKRVLVSDGERVVMEENLGEALNVLFGFKEKTSHLEQNGIGGVVIDDGDLVMSANKYYAEILKAMSKQDWTEMGDNFDKLGDILKELEK
jgi:uncharacterized protein